MLKEEITQVLKAALPAEISEIRKANNAGYKGHNKYIWCACEKCGRERWVGIRKGMARYCRECNLGRRGEEHWNWRGGRHEDGQGYIRVRVYPDDFFYPMADCKGYVLEHRLVMAKTLGRCLLPSEIVHHRPDVARDDNRSELLYLMPNLNEHNKFLPCANCELKKEIRLLRWQIIELQKQLRGNLL